MKAEDKFTQNFKTLKMERKSRTEELIETANRRIEKSETFEVIETEHQKITRKSMFEAIEDVARFPQSPPD